MKMRSVLLLTCFVALILVGLGTARVDTPKTKDGVFIHISHGENHPHRVLMALQMANVMSDDRDVLVYFDINGIEVILKDADDLKYSHFPSTKQQLSALLDKGVILMACPGCLKAAGKTAKDLAPGIQIADKDRFFSFTEGRILTLDY